MPRRLVWVFLTLAFGLSRPAPCQTPRPAPPPPGTATAPDAHGINSTSPLTGRGLQGAPRPQVVPTPPTLGPGQTTGGEEVEEIPPPSPPPHGWARQIFTVPRTSQPPTLDGRLADDCWKTALRARGFYRYGGGTPSAQQTECWVCADKTHVYFAFRCRDQHPELIHASVTQRNGDISHDDFVGVDIDSQGKHRGFSTFIVNPRGALFDQLEGGTADNITWAGDWKAATARTAHGWNCEISIPFALMRYPKGTKSFNMILYRQIGRETSLQSWPYIPSAGASDNTSEALYLNTFAGIAPPVYTPHPTFLPYTLATAGTGNSVREGLDVKYPLSTTLTGVGTLFPDFQTIEQDVTNINFSYTEKLLTDRRPFFAEGSDFLPGQDIFYSRRIATVDGGVKVVGKENNTSVGVLATGSRGPDSQSASVVNLRQDLGLYSYVAGNLADSIQPGLPSNQVAKLEGVYGWQMGTQRYAVQADHLPSWNGGRIAGSKDFYQISNQPPLGHVGVSVNYQDIAPNFVSNLGFNPELDLRGPAASAYQYNQFDKGWLESYSVSSSAGTFQHHTGGFFESDIYNSASIRTRKGLSYTLAYDIGRRNQIEDDDVTLDQFHDHVATLGFGWGRKTLYQRGSVSENTGRQSGQAYNFLTLSQGIFVSRPFSLQLDYSQLVLGGANSTQAIATGTYRLNEFQTIGGRVVNQAGVDQGTGLGTDIYFSFSQQVRRGTDVFVLFGDPNSPRTRGKFTLKLVRPF